MDKMIGKMLDNRYELLEVIGVGGMAVVYKAKCHRLNRYVAVKILKDEYARDEEFRKRFFDESQAVAMLSHPNIVSVYDVSQSDGIDYIVMELIDGITLKDYLVRRGPLSWRETTFFSLQIAKALEHAHSRDIIHRDIKPQNIMLLRDGTVKVADFGIAHHVSSKTDYSKGEAIGSVHYVSPEQARGSIIDNRSDLYSLGVVMYEMLTGRLPFEGNTPMEVAIQHINSIPLLPSDYVAGIPKALEAITMKAMSPQPSRRYSSASEMIADLERFKSDPSMSIEIENAVLDPEDPDQQPSEMDATIKIANTGQVQKKDVPVTDEPTKPVKLRHEADKREEPEEDDDADERHGVHPIVFALIAVALLFGLAVFGAYRLLTPFGGTDEKIVLQVPALEGKLYADVMNSPETYSGFDIKVDEEMNSDDAVGTILSQKPEAGKPVSEGTAVHITVSLGPKTLTLDDYSQMNGRSVMVILDRLGLKATEEKVFSDDVEEGLVVETIPAAKTVVKAGSAVTVRVSKGREFPPLTVPNLVGMTLEEAEKTLKELKLTIGTATQTESDEQAPGCVIFQSLDEGTEVEEGAVINVHVAMKKDKEPDATTEPDKPSHTTKPEEPSTGEEKPPFLIPEIKVDYRVRLDDELAGDIQLMVAIDKTVVYNAVHKADELYVTVPIKAQEGPHTVTVYQNGKVTTQETVEFYDRH